MKIMCPKVIVLNELSERAKFGRGHISFDERTVEIYEKAQFTELDMIEVLAHEMRHCWQRDKYCEKFFCTINIPKNIIRLVGSNICYSLRK